MEKSNLKAIEYLQMHCHRLTRLALLPPLAEMVYSLREETANSVVLDPPKNRRLADPLFAIARELFAPMIDLRYF